jgi:hypothetical protein
MERYVQIDEAAGAAIRGAASDLKVDIRLGALVRESMDSGRRDATVECTVRRNDGTRVSVILPLLKFPDYVSDPNVIELSLVRQQPVTA